MHHISTELKRFKEEISTTTDDINEEIELIAKPTNDGGGIASAA